MPIPVASRISLLLAGGVLVLAQTPAWETAAGGAMSFEVASIKPTKTFLPPLFPLDPGDAYATTNGRFKAVFPLSIYVHFAYKLPNASIDEKTFPKWASTERFAIEAKAPTDNPTKDQMRLMMQDLLRDRFHLAIHFETREMPRFRLVLVKPGKLGPKLIRHEEGPSCDAAPPAGTFPERCEVQSMMSRRGVITQASRNTTLALLADVLGQAGRPVIDQTGLAGKFDYRLEYGDDQRGPDASSDPEPPSFQQALHEQLGLKLEAAKVSIEMLVVDRLERPSEN